MDRQDAVCLDNYTTTVFRSLQEDCLTLRRMLGVPLP